MASARARRQRYNNVVHLTRFELSELSGFTGGRVVKAQLRYYLGTAGPSIRAWRTTGSSTRRTAAGT